MSRVGTVAEALRDAFAGFAARPGRSLLVAGTIALAGVSSIAVVGLTGGSRAEVASLVAARDSPYVVASVARTAEPISALETSRLVALSGVASWATVTPQTEVEVTDLAGRYPAARFADVVGATGPLPEAAGIAITQGRALDAGHEQRLERVALVGAGAARRLDLPPADGRATVFLGGRPYLIGGVFEDGPGGSALAGKIVIPSSAMAADFGIAGTDAVFVFTATPAEAPAVAEHLPTRIRPTRPLDLDVSYVAADPGLADALDAELRRLSLLVLITASVLAAAIVAAVMTASVIERRHEIGLRRSLGATTMGIARMHALEGVTLGAIGGAGGLIVAAGVLLWLEGADVAALSLPGWLPWLVLAQGPLVGTVAAIVPAVRSARLDPVDALGDR